VATKNDGHVLRGEPARELEAIVQVLDARAQEARRADGPRRRDPAAERHREGGVDARAGAGEMIWLGLGWRLRDLKMYEYGAKMTIH
jgi:anti-sigma factor ChrR (cupin superfamily)